jgi:hypothetical protein
MKAPLLFLVFNRPDITRRTFEAIRAAKPPRLYVAADGPRPDRDGEVEDCAKVRLIATDVDWPCEVYTLFQETNLGCGLGPLRGIDWFFEHESEGIILEDDILPLPSFFPYCDQLLERYRDDERVGMISGCNLVSEHFSPQESYFFSRYINISGWASWRRAWEQYDVEMGAWPAWRDRGGLRSVSDGNRFFESSWRRVFDRTYKGGVDWWDYQWFFAFWYRGMLAAMPARNQTLNAGFGPGATHTPMSAPACVRESVPQPLRFPLVHPSSVERSPSADKMISTHVHGLTLAGTMKGHLMTLKCRVRNTPVLGDFLKKLQLRLSNAH